MPHSNSSTSSVGLPQDEFRKYQRTHCLTEHFRHSGRPATSWHHSQPDRDAQMSYEDCFQSSQVRFATRNALGTSFNFDDASYKRSCGHQVESQRSRGWGTDINDRDGQIPKKYIDEFNQYMHEQDEDHDADQYMADHMRGAPWRQPAHLLEPPNIESTANSYQSSSCNDSGICMTEPRFRSSSLQHDYSARPQLQSHFSFEDEPRLEKGFFIRFLGPQKRKV